MSSVLPYKCKYKIKFIKNCDVELEMQSWMPICTPKSEFKLWYNNNFICIFAEREEKVFLDLEIYFMNRFTFTKNTPEKMFWHQSF